MPKNCTEQVSATRIHAECSLLQPPQRAQCGKAPVGPWRAGDMISQKNPLLSLVKRKDVIRYMYDRIKKRLALQIDHCFNKREDTGDRPQHYLYSATATPLFSPI